MKLDKEKFNKLKQLDRIEFRQKLDRIEGMDSSIKIVVWSLLIILSIFLTGYFISEELIFIDLLIKIFFITFLAVIVEVGLIIGFSISRMKLRKELFEEYFSIEVKK